MQSGKKQTNKQTKKQTKFDKVVKRYLKKKTILFTIYILSGLLWVHNGVFIFCLS